MCLKLPARVISVAGQEAEIEVLGGSRLTANITLRPDVAVGQYVLVDRGLVLEVIEAAEAEAIMAMYGEIGQMLGDADASPWPVLPVEDQTRVGGLEESHRG